MKHLLFTACSVVLLAVVLFAGAMVAAGDYTLTRGGQTTHVAVINDGQVLVLDDKEYLWNSVTGKYHPYPAGAPNEFEQVDDNTYNLVGGGTMVKN